MKKDISIIFNKNNSTLQLFNDLIVPELYPIAKFAPFESEKVVFSRIIAKSKDFVLENKK